MRSGRITILPSAGIGNVLFVWNTLTHLVLFNGNACLCNRLQQAAHGTSARRYHGKSSRQAGLLAAQSAGSTVCYVSCHCSQRANVSMGSLQHVYIGSDGVPND